MGYGATNGRPKAVFSLRPLLGEIAWCVAAPSGLFALLLAVMSLCSRPDAPWLCVFLFLLTAGIALCVVLAVCYIHRESVLRLKDAIKAGDPIAWRDLWPSLMCLGGAVAWVLAVWVGEGNWYEYVRPLQQYRALRNYVDVDPAYHLGAEMLDAGRVFFDPDCWVDRSRAVAFKSTEDVYCVAPITSPKFEAGVKAMAENADALSGVAEALAGAAGVNATALLSRKPVNDFWAVGVNCCPYHNPGASFKCGADDAHAGSGVRVLDEALLEHYWPAIKQAEMILDVQAPNPVVVHWSQDAAKHLQAFWTDAVDRVMFGISTFVLVQSFVVTVCAVYLWRKTPMDASGQPPAALA
jgi:hypothetical protein